MRSDRLLIIAAFAGIALFAGALIVLFDARVQSGDIYPVYSSLRSDGEGTKAYYESINTIKGLTAERLFEPLKEFRGRNATIFVLGIDPGEKLADYEQLATAGNRLVIGLPSRAVARGTPVFHERKYGNGSIVMLADTHALTNEALLRSRNTGLLTGLLGNNRRIVFSEHHLGIYEREGVVSLARRYQLHGLAAGLLLIAGLFIWRNSSSFLPRVDDQGSEDEVSGRAASSGLTNLLGRAIPGSELINVCIEEWTRSMPRAVSGEVMRAAAGSGDAVESYRRIAELLTERRRR
jgi:hypothetical protein